MKKRELFDKKKLIWILLISLFVISIFYDVKIIKLIAGLRNIIFDYIFIGISFASNLFVIFFFITAFFLYTQSKRRWILSLWLSILLSSLVNLLIKILIRRQRPFETGIISVLSVSFYFMKDNFNTWNFSFPSGQTVLVFCIFPLLNKEYRRFRYFWFFFASLVAFSRVYLGVHYLSDVIAGAIIGYLIGYFMIKVEEKYPIGAGLIKKLKLD